MSEKLDLNLRYEIFDDKENASGFGGTTIQSYTVTTAIKLVDNRLVLKPEFRIDLSPTPHFEYKDTGNTKTSQASLNLGLIFQIDKK